MRITFDLMVRIMFMQQKHHKRVSSVIDSRSTFFAFGEKLNTIKQCKMKQLFNCKQCFNSIYEKIYLRSRAGGRAVDLGGPSVYQGGGGQSLKLSTKAAVFKRVSLLIGGVQEARPPCPPLPFGPGPEYEEMYEDSKSLH